MSFHICNERKEQKEQKEQKSTPSIVRCLPGNPESSSYRPEAMAVLPGNPQSSQAQALGISLIVSQILEAIENEQEENAKVIGGNRFHDYPSSRREKNGDLAACALVNRLWHQEAIRILYDTFEIPLYAERKRKDVSGQDIQDDYSEDEDENEEWGQKKRNRRYDSLLYRFRRTRRQHIASQVHTLALFVSPYSRGSNRLIYTEMLSRLEFPRLRRLKLKGIDKPLLGVTVVGKTELLAAQSKEDDMTPRSRSELEAYKTLFSSPNLGHLDISETWALSYALYLEHQIPTLWTAFLSRLTALSLRVTPKDHPRHLSFLQHCRRLQRLELCDLAEIFPRKATFATIMAIVFTCSPSLEVLHINRSKEQDEAPEASSEWPSPRPPLPLLRELVFDGFVQWADLLLQHVDPSILETLNLRTLAKGTETLNLDHLTDRGFPKLRNLTLSRSPPLREVQGFKRSTLSPQKLLSVLDGTPNLINLTIDTVVGSVEEVLIWPRHLGIDIDDDFLSKLGARLPRLERLTIKNDPHNAKWTSAGFITLGRCCRYLTHFDVGGPLDITDPVFEDALREYGLFGAGEQVKYTAESAPGAETQSRKASNGLPLFPCLRTLVITPLPPRADLSDEYPAEVYPRAPPSTVSRIHRLLATHFPYLISIFRFEINSSLHMELRRKYTTGDWPQNRLSYFASPWYVRLERRQIMWKFETCRRSSEVIKSHDSDSNSSIDSEDGTGAFDSDQFVGDDIDSEEEHDEKQNFGGILRRNTGPARVSYDGLLTLNY